MGFDCLIVCAKFFLPRSGSTTKCGVEFRPLNNVMFQRFVRKIEKRMEIIVEFRLSRSITVVYYYLLYRM